MGRLPNRWLITVVLVAAPLLVGAACSDDPEVVLDLSPAAKAGQEVFEANACSACHSIDGEVRTGPTWQGLWGSTVELEGGGTTTVDAAYVERAIREPNADRAADATGSMPAFDESRITDDQIADIVAFLKEIPAG